MKSLLFLPAVFMPLVFSKVFFEETFMDGDAWKKRWIQSKHKSDYGEFKLSAGKFYGDAEESKGVQTSQDARFYSLTSKFKEEVKSTKDQPFVIQFSVKHEQNIDCGGGYVKVFKNDIKVDDVHGETPYSIMFGPDICGPTKKVHVIIGYKGKNYLIKKDITAESDELTHLYTLIIKPDNTYQVLIDNEEKAKGSFEEDWDILPPKTIPDPKAKKPADWVDEEKIDDPEDVKPEGYDDIPELIVDPEATKPSDWDDEMDGEWEAPKIKNPEWNGEWKAKKIANPDYKGPWVHPSIANPEYYEDKEIYIYKDLAYIGLDLWQVKSGTIFDNFFFTDSVDAAKEHGKKHWEKFKNKEKDAKKKLEDEEKKKSEEEAKKNADDNIVPPPVADFDSEGFDTDHDEL